MAGTNRDGLLQCKQVQQCDPCCLRGTHASLESPQELSYVSNDRGRGDEVTALNHRSGHPRTPQPAPHASLQQQTTRTDLLLQTTSPTSHAFVDLLPCHEAGHGVVTEQSPRKSFVGSSCWLSNPPLPLAHVENQDEAAASESIQSGKLPCTVTVGLGQVAVGRYDVDLEPSTLLIDAQRDTAAVRSDEGGMLQQNRDRGVTVDTTAQPSPHLPCAPELSPSQWLLHLGGATKGPFPHQTAASVSTAFAAAIPTSPPGAAASPVATVDAMASTATFPKGVGFQSPMGESYHGIQLCTPRLAPHGERPPLPFLTQLPALSSIAVACTASAMLGDGVKRDSSAVTAAQQSPGSSTNGLSVFNFQSGGSVPNAVSVLSPVYLVGTPSADDFIAATNITPCHMSQCQPPPPLDGGADVHKPPPPQHQPPPPPPPPQLLSVPHLNRTSSFSSGVASTSSAVGHTAKQRPSRFCTLRKSDRATRRPSLPRLSSPCAPSFTSHASRHIPFLSGNLQLVSDSDRCNDSSPPSLPPATPSCQLPLQSSCSARSTPHIPALDFSSISDGPIVRNGEVVDAPWWGSSVRRSRLPSPYFSATGFSHGYRGGCSSVSDFSGYGEDDDESEDVSANCRPVARKAEELQRLKMHKNTSSTFFSDRFDDADAGSNDEECIDRRHEKRPHRGSACVHYLNRRPRAAADCPRRSINSDTSCRFLRGCCRGALHHSSRTGSSATSWVQVIKRLVSTACMFLFRIGVIYFSSLLILRTRAAMSS